MSLTSAAVVAAIAVLAPLCVTLAGLRVPPIVLEILLGIAVGPHVLGWAEVGRPVGHTSKGGLVGFHPFHVGGGEGIVPQELLVAVPERLDGVGLDVLDGIDVLGLDPLGGVRAPISSCLVLPGGGFLLLDRGFPSLGGAVLLLRPTDGLLIGGPRLLPFGQARRIAP